MKLINKLQSVPGGLWYKVPETGKIISTDSTFDRLLDAVSTYYVMEDIPLPPYWQAAVEDQICSRIPSKFCRYTKGAGDQVSKIIHGAARLVDKIFGTNLEGRARGCGGCGRRRQRMNQGQ